MFFKKKKKREKTGHEVLLGPSVERQSVRRRKSVVSTRAHPKRPPRGRGSISRARSSLNRRMPRSPGYIAHIQGQNKGEGRRESNERSHYQSQHMIRPTQSTHGHEGQGRRAHYQGQVTRHLDQDKRHLSPRHPHQDSDREGVQVNRRNALEGEDSSVYYEKPLLKRPPEEPKIPQAPPLPHSYQYEDPNKPPFTRKQRSPKARPLQPVIQNRQVSYSDQSNTSSESEKSHQVVSLARGRSTQDVRQWLSWRVKVNDQLASYVMRMVRNGQGQHRHFPVNEIPQSMTDDTLNSILNQALNDDDPVTSLDRYSYMIYGVPRVRSAVRKAPSRSRSTRSWRGSYRMLRRKLSRKLNNNNANPSSFFGNRIRSGYQDISSQEETLDFTDEYLWTDDCEEDEQETEEEVLSEDLYRKPSVVKRNKMAVHQQLLQRTRSAFRGENNEFDSQDENIVRRTPVRGQHVLTRPSNVERHISSRRGRQIPGRRNESFIEQGLQRPPPIPGGVPTLLAGIQNLPNQAHVPLRHVLPKKSETQASVQRTEWSKNHNRTGMR